MENNFTLNFDPYDSAGMKEIMQQHGDSEFPFYGENEQGEAVSISVFHDKIIVVTEQTNGWRRKNIYHEDGTTEELFDGKWR